MLSKSDLSRRSLVGILGIPPLSISVVVYLSVSISGSHAVSNLYVMGFNCQCVHDIHD
jgi:hypothetical protein